jgi:putative transposase
VRFIDEHADHRVGDGLVWGVEPICAVLSEHGCKIAPSTYYEARVAARTPPARLVRDEVLKDEIVRVHPANYGVYGTRKVWLALNREDVPVARCTVERLMRQLGLVGARRGKKVRTTISDPAATRPADLVGRQFAALAPDRLWVADYTYVATWSAMVYVAFVIDAYARRILGWRVATSMHTELVLDALEQAIWTRAREGRADLRGLVSHSDAGSQGGSRRSGRPGRPLARRCGQRWAALAYGTIRHQPVYLTLAVCVQGPARVIRWSPAAVAQLSTPCAGDGVQKRNVTVFTVSSV